MQFPFRNPVTDNAGDGDPPEWTPPSYAKETENNDSEEWKPPSYAEPVKAEASKKPSVFSRAIDAIKPEKSARPIDLGVAIPAQYRQFLDEHPSIKSVLKGGVADPDIPLKQKVSELFNGKQTDTQDHKILGPEMTPIPFAKEVGEYIKDKGISSGKYSLGAAGSVINDILNSFPADARGAFPEAKEPSLRQSGRMSAESAAKPLDASIRPPSELSGDLSLPREESQVKQPLKSNLEKVSEPINKADVPREFVLPEDEAAHNEAVKEDKPAGMAEDKLYDLARNKQGMAQDLPAADVEEVKKPNFINPFEKPKIETAPEESAEGWKPPEYAQPAVEETPKEIPKSNEESISELAPKKFVDRLQEYEDAASERIKQRGTFSGTRLSAGLPVDDLKDLTIIGAAKLARGVVKFADWSAEMIEKFGDEIKPHLAGLFQSAKKQHEQFSFSASKKLFNSLIEAKGQNFEQQGINKAEQAKRFAAFDSVKTGGIAGAREQMEKLKGAFEKAEPGEPLGLSPIETNTLFTTIKNSKLSAPEKARGYTALNKLLNGEEIPQKNELEILDQALGKHLSRVSGPGASGKFDIKNPTSFVEAGEKLRKTPDDFLSKLANFSSKSTRAVLGFHVPGTAVSFHGFNEAIRNTMFGSSFSPLKAAERFANAAYYLARPGKAQAFLDANLGDLGKAVEEGGLRITTGDIGNTSMFKGNNIVTKGINALTSPKPLFEQVIPALKLKGYQGLLEQYEKSGIPHDKAAKLAGEATNNIFGGLNIGKLEQSPTTRKLLRASLLAPDWLQSNVRLGKGMFDAIKDPMNPKSKVYLTGVSNFLGSYVALNVLNAINNNGKFSYQNEVGHEFDVAIGKDSAGKTRYISPYGTAMDMIRIPLEIAHAAVEGNMGKAFSDMRSRASEPIQFSTDLMTNTNYAGRALYDKTKYGKHIPALEQGENIAGDAAGHFLPVGIESGINLAQGKVSPEQFASQVLQLPMKYKTPEQNPHSLKLRKMKAK